MVRVEARSQPGTFALRALAPLALMALIFVLSAQPDLDSGLGTLDLILRKLVHMAEYGLLTVLWAWALAPVLGARGELAGAAIAFLYAITDEYHQTFVEGRHGVIADVGIDAVGIGVALILLRYHRTARGESAIRGRRAGE